jgi:hypothetical protein
MNVSPTDEFERLENALIRAGKSVTYPATPAFDARVRAELEAPRRRALGLPRWAVAVAVAIIVAIGLLIAFPTARDALAQILGLRTIRIIFVTPTPTPIITPTLNPSVTPTAIPLPTQTPALRVQCCETTLANAQAQATFKILLPPTDSPTRVYLQSLPNFGNAQQVILVFGSPSAPQFTLFQATNILYGKMLAVYGTGGEGGTIITETTVSGHRALWLSGAPHVLVYLDANGQPQFATERTVNANTLAWEIGNVTYRLETNANEPEAVRFAESLR